MSQNFSQVKRQNQWYHCKYTFRFIWSFSGAPSEVCVFFHSSQFFGPFHLNFLPLWDLLGFSSFRFLLFRSKGSLENFHFENLDEKKKKSRSTKDSADPHRFNVVVLPSQAFLKKFKLTQDDRSRTDKHFKKPFTIYQCFKT